MYISDFQSLENSSSIYGWNAHKIENQLSLPKKVEKH